MNDDTLLNIVRWATDKGLIVQSVDAVPTTLSVWNGTAIDGGVLLYDSDAHPGDVLHELGHIALTPELFRSRIQGDLAMNSDPLAEMADSMGIPINEQWGYLNDTAVIGWSYFAALDANVDTMLPFVNGHNGCGREIHDRIAWGIGHPMGSAESCQLFYAGLLNKKGSHALCRFIY